MQIYLPFGDWSGDGHNQYVMRLVDAPSKNYILNARDAIDKKYPGIWSGFAQDYNNPFLSEDVWRALIENGYSLEYLKSIDDNGVFNNENINTWDDVLSLEEDERFITIDIVIDSAIFLLNKYGAKITVLDNNTPVLHWESPGYGCFYS